MTESSTIVRLPRKTCTYWLPLFAFIWYNGFCDITTDSVISIEIAYNGFCIPYVQSDCQLSISENSLEPGSQNYYLQRFSRFCWVYSWVCLFLYGVCFQHCWWCACQISERSDNCKHKSHGFETLARRSYDKTSKSYRYWNWVLGIFTPLLRLSRITESVVINQQNPV